MDVYRSVRDQMHSTEEMGAKFGDEDGVVVRLSDAMAEAHSKPRDIDSKSPQVEKEQTSLEHLEYFNEAAAIRDKEWDWGAKSRLW